jgi:uncharacterized protein
MTANVKAERARILVFAKAPEPGHVKTRLIARLGPGRAAALHALLVERTLHTAVAAAAGGVELWCAPSASHPWLRQCAERHSVDAADQCEGDLGARMLHAAEHTLAAASRVVIVGTDCPELTVSDFEQAVAALGGGHDAVLMPAEDGGYTLIGLSRCDRRLFESIEWGGPRVLAATRDRLATLGWRVHELRRAWDVDRPEDYLRLAASNLIPDLQRKLDQLITR